MCRRAQTWVMIGDREYVAGCRGFGCSWRRTYVTMAAACDAADAHAREAS